MSARREELARTVQTAERTVPGLETALQTLDPLCSQRAELSYALVQLYGTAPGYTWPGEVPRDASFPSEAVQRLAPYLHHKRIIYVSSKPAFCIRL